MNCVSFSPDGKLAAVAGAETREEEPRDHEIKLWEVPSGKLHASLDCNSRAGDRSAPLTPCPSAV
jgi:hypothetical protein